MDMKHDTASLRINKYLSDAGVCSRRAADRMLEAGRVHVDGNLAAVGSRVLPGQQVTVDGKEVKIESERILLVVNKPVGIICTASEDEPDNIVRYLNYPIRIYYAGRLDKDSEGLLLMTNQGELVNQMMRARNHHEKEYLVTVNKPITKAFLRGMSGHVPILDTVTRTSKVSQVDERTFNIILTQGLNRQIRRMCGYFGYNVASLKRIRIMNIELGHLPTGAYRKATEAEWNQLLEILEREGSV